MSISFNRYVDITSGVGGATQIPARDFGARIFTTNPLVPTGSYIEFSNAASVLDYFGSTSEEYLRASFYFGWVSKNITSAQKISFARWADSAVGSTIYGIPATYAVGDFTPVSTGDFTLTLGGFTYHLTGIDFSGAGSLSVVAGDIQAKIRAYTAGGAAWTGATVTYNAVRGSFDLVSGDTGADTISVTAGSTVDVVALVGWGAGAIFSNGSAAESLTTVLTNSDNDSDNFGSFLFIDAASFTLTQLQEIGAWNTTKNVKYMFLAPVTAANAASYSAGLQVYAGIALTLVDIVNYSNEFDEMAAGMILAATDYTARNSTQNFMFQQFGLTAKVTSDTAANTYDALIINYYGVSQTNGAQIAFYQRGILTGIAPSPLDQNTYANEMWFKSFNGAALGNLLLAQAQVSANTQGLSQVVSVLQSGIDLAKFNGTISAGKPLNVTQKVYITNATGSNTAWQQVQTLGYWLGVSISTYTAPDNRTEYQIIYTLIYSKNDQVRKIKGTQVLI